jgi:hypothetical protein
MTMAFFPSLAQANEAWWRVNVGAAPTELPPGGEGRILLGVSDLGNASADGTKSPIVLKDTLPAGLSANSISGAAWNGNKQVPLTCDLAGLSCEYDGVLRPYELIEVSIGVSVQGAESGALDHLVVSGGEAPSVSVSRPLRVGSATPFGIEENVLAAEEEGGSAPTQAGSHPFQTTSTIVLSHNAAGEPVKMAKDVTVKLPAGFVGDPQSVPQCPLGKFLKVETNSYAADECPPQTAIGIAQIHVYSPLAGDNIVFAVPLFNLEPGFGEPARFGFYFIIGEAPVVLDLSLRSGPGEDYGVNITAHNITQSALFFSSQITVWGDPDDPRHDSERGWGCLDKLYEFHESLPCSPLEDSSPHAFQMLSTSCEEPKTGALADSWAQPADLLSFPESEQMKPLDGCNRVPFTPTVHASPTTTNTASASGLDFDVYFHDEGLTSPGGVAQSHLKNTTVVLPEGLTINPSAGVGLASCAPEQYAKETLASAPGEGCPPESKLGTVTIESPLLAQRIDGNVYIAQPFDNPFGSLVALYIVAKNPETGVLLKLVGKVTPDPVTGRLTTTFENNPQLPFSHFNFHFREGAQAPLITPAECGSYTVQALLSPWSEPSQTVTDSSSFTLTKGSDGGACPSGGVPFKPGITAGTLNNSAGSFSTFYVDLTRSDADQEIAGFSTDMPSGLTGDLSGVPYCPEANIEASRHNTGRAEEAGPSCPAASQIGHTLVGTGVGSVLAYVSGKIYLAGPYDGDPFSIVSITSAVVGPFDLGTVVLRFGLHIDPTTAQVSVEPTSSEPIPTIIDGIVTHVRDIRVYIDRPKFILNPTTCDPASISSALSSDQKQSVTVSSHFQATNCAALGFKPSFKASTSGKTSRTKGASLSVKLAYPSGSFGKDANIRSVKVDLPKQLPSRLTTLQNACLASVFKVNPASCPANSRVGIAKATTPILPVPLEGPAYFVSYGGAKFPELIVVLQGDGVTIDLHGETFISKAGITSSTFRAVPDQPVTSFELTLPQGPDSALAANGNLCGVTRTVLVKRKVKVRSKGHSRTVTRALRRTLPASLLMPTVFTAQNGTVIKQSTPIEVTGCAKVKTKGKAARHGKKR